MKVRQTIRLHASGKSMRFISNYLGLSRNTIKKYLDHIQQQGYDNESLLELDDEHLQEIFEPELPVLPEKTQQAYDFFPGMEKRLKRPGMTKQRLWEIYKKQHSTGYSRSQFCHYYLQWKRKSAPVMHFDHKAGDKAFLDFAGQKLPVVDSETGEIQEMEVFISILGASQYTYVEAVESQSKEDFIKCVENSFIFFNGVPQAVVPDNLKSAVTKSNRYEPVLNECFRDFAEHYGTTVIPARVRKPRDKSLVEGAVRIIYMRIFTKLQGETFNDLKSLNNRIWQELDKHNNTPFQGRKYSRKDLFEEIERTELKSLPASKYEIKEYAVGTVYKTSHVYLGKDKHFYSVPYQHIGKRMKIIFSKSQVRIYHKYRLITAHKRDKTPYRYTTIKDHLPSTHQFVSDWNPEKFLSWAEGIGIHTHDFIKHILEQKQYPEQSYRSCVGVLQFAKKIGNRRLENACSRALDFGIYNYSIIKKILEKGMDKLAEETADIKQLPEHQNIRGENYYK